MYQLRLSCQLFWVDVRLATFDGRWIASADTPYGPSLGLGWTPREALRRALDEYEGVVDDLLATAPDDLLEHGATG